MGHIYAAGTVFLKTVSGGTYDAIIVDAFDPISMYTNNTHDYYTFFNLKTTPYVIISILLCCHIMLTWIRYLL